MSASHANWEKIGLKRALLIALLSFFTLAGCVPRKFSSPPYNGLRTKNVQIGKRGMVVTVDDIASSAGLEILKKGGNAVDAAVAVAFVLAVTHPQAGNIGGGGFMVMHFPGEGREVALDFRETAPEKATPTMYLEADGSLDKDRAERGFLAVGVPGTVAGLSLALERFGSMEWQELLEPAIRLAREGFLVDKDLAVGLRDAADGLRRNKAAARIFLKENGEPYTVGELLVQRDLAWSMEQIAQRGPDAFYNGPVGERLVEDVEAQGGLITLADLKKYKAKVRKPSSTTYRGYRVMTMPLPSSGGTALMEMLNIVENFPLHEMGFPSLEAIHIITEAMKRSYRDRACLLGDSDFVNAPVEKLISKSYAKKIASRISMASATPSVELAEGRVEVKEGSHTTHFSVVDGMGNAVACTYTINSWFGAKVVARGTGILLNNEMPDFNVIPGRTDKEGNIGTPPNLIAPGKRMLSSMTPTIVFKNEKPFLVLGSPGGRTIINTVLLVILQVLDFRKDLSAAVRGGRFHHQWFPDTLRVEKGMFTEEMVEALRNLGHNTKEIRSQGDLQGIQIFEDGTFLGVSDHRIDGCAAGY